MLTRLAIITALVLPWGCAADTAPAGADAEGAAKILDVGEGGAADAAGFTVVEMGGAGRWTVDIAALPAGVSATVDNLGGVAHAFRLRLDTPAAVAFTVRTVEGDVDAHVVLKGGDGETLAIGSDQAVLAMAREEDSVVNFDAEAGADYIFVVADQHLTGAGRVVVDLVIFEDSPGANVGWTSPGVLNVCQELRDREPLLASYLTDGVILEDTDGHVLVGDRSSVPLRDRSSITGLVNRVNDYRDVIHRHYNDEDRAAVGRALAQLYWVARTP
ncbi:MAG: hypothetical protein DRJ42_05190 [Deltaproteobacteria bacterium]|nr:MAG: hypothetical protein DRJ42_05190 [Deltaproteobacteria bacterium]